MSPSRSQLELDAELTRRWVTRGVVAVAVLTLVGLGMLWPRGEAPDLGTQPNTFVDAVVTDIDRTRCPAVDADALTGCSVVSVEVDVDDDTTEPGEFVVRDTDFSVPDLDIGDRVVLLDVPTSPPPYRFTFSDFQRATSMWWLLVLFVVAVVAIGRWQGARALAGLAGSAVIIVVFLVPSLIRNESAVAVALVAAAAIAFLAFYVAHGINPATTVALAGTLVSLAAITFLALLATDAARLSGLVSEEAQALRVTASALDLRGLLIAGIVIGALGVLDDVTVTQVSTVAALKRTNPDLDALGAYREAMRVGRDHVASVVNTLILAYAGATLPLVLLFSQGSKPTGRILTSEIVSVEIVRMLVGSIGLILSVPITTALAATVLTGRELVHAGHDHGTLGEAPVGHLRSDLGELDRPEADPDDDARWQDFGPEEDRI